MSVCNLGSLAVPQHQPLAIGQTSSPEMLGGQMTGKCVHHWVCQLKNRSFIALQHGQITVK